MTQVCSLPPSTADANAAVHGKRLPKGIRIIGADNQSAPRGGGISKSAEAEALPWGYIIIHHLSANVFEQRLAALNTDDGFKPRCFIHRTVTYRSKANGRGVIKEEKPSVSGLVFLQGRTRQLKRFLKTHYPDYFLVNNCSTGQPASIADSLMRPFMHILEAEPERVTFLRDPFVKFARDHVRLRVLTGLLAGQEGYVVRILRNRQLVMDFGGYAVAINNVHNEDFEIAE